MLLTKKIIKIGQCLSELLLAKVGAFFETRCIFIYRLDDTLDTLASASASYVLVSASRKIFALGLDLTLSGLVLGLVVLWPH